MRTVFFLLAIALGQITFAQTYPPNIYGDTIHAPFYWGVASGDPMQDKVLIWTRIKPVSSTDSLNVNWEMSSDSLFTQAIDNGAVMAIPEKDWTVMIDVAGLEAGSIYYYRFWDDDNKYSARGRTKTAPSGSVSVLKFGVASCSSIFSGYFNAYGRMAERDLDLVIHVGDYIYDFVDQDEEVRVPDPYPINPSNLEEFRDRHKYYLLDPDLRSARQNHPFIVMWDNHDIEGRNEPEPIQAFEEYVPMRLNDNSAPERIYRSFNYGGLVDIIMLDVQMFRDIDTLPNGEDAMMDIEQLDWILSTLDSSSSKWRILGTSKLMGAWNIPLIQIGSGTGNSWDGFPGTRAKLLNHLDQNGIDNNVVISGDLHMSIGCDLSLDPFDSNVYDPATGEGSIAVEILPTSISRGNADESGISPSLIPTAEQISLQNNPHHVYTDITRHGYGILNITPDSVVAEYWYSEILEQTTEEEFGGGLVTKDGENHWEREVRNTPFNEADSLNSLPELDMFNVSVSDVFPNPGTQTFNIKINAVASEKAHVRIVTFPTAQLVKEFDWNLEAGESKYSFDIPSSPNGYYAIMIETGEAIISRSFVQQ